MEAEDDIFNAAASPRRKGRPICGNCSRPSPVCLCHALPARPIPTQTQIIILHHPHEAQHKLSTTPILTKCLANSTAIVARRLRPGLSPLLDQPPSSAVYLFPPSKTSPSLKLSDLRSPPAVVVAFDATWRHAREMVKASEGFLGGFARRVSLEVDEGVRGGSIYDSELILRTEPCEGCVSTMEAVARVLGAVEPDGVEIERRLIGVLREMVKLQKGFVKPVKERVEVLKKGKENRAVAVVVFLIRATSCMH